MILDGRHTQHDCISIDQHLADALLSTAVPQAPELRCNVSRATLESCLDDVSTVMRRPGLLQRAEELVPHSVGHMLLTLASIVEEHIDDFK